MSLPNRVEAAIQFLRWSRDERNPPPNFDGMRAEGRDLSKNEQAAHDMAVEVFRKYLSGEEAYADQQEGKP